MQHAQPTQQPAPVGGIHMSSRAEPGRETPTKKLFDNITKEIAKLYVGQDELVLGALVGGWLGATFGLRFTVVFASSMFVVGGQNHGP